MHIIKLDAIDSTNAFLKQKSSVDSIDDYTIVMANYQTNGRGQMGSLWDSQAYKNLIVSVYKDVSFLDVEDAFYISIVTSLSIIKTLQGFLIPKLSVKWPNDILSENKKICGVLIENVIKQDSLCESIIGVGLNINQTEFNDFPNASSLKIISGTFYNLDEVLQTMISHLKNYFSVLRSGDLELLKAEYEALLFRKNKPSTFKDSEGVTFSGFIKGISNTGNLQVLLEDNIIKEFSLKELSLLY